MSELIDYIWEELLEIDYGCEIQGISEPNMTQLFILKGLIEVQLFDLRNELDNKENRE